MDFRPTQAASDAARIIEHELSGDAFEFAATGAEATVAQPLLYEPSIVTEREQPATTAQVAVGRFSLAAQRGAAAAVGCDHPGHIREGEAVQVRIDPAVPSVRDGVRGDVGRRLELQLRAQLTDEGRLAGREQEIHIAASAWLEHQR